MYIVVTEHLSCHHLQGLYKNQVYVILSFRLVYYYICFKVFFVDVSLKLRIEIKELKLLLQKNEVSYFFFSGSILSHLLQNLILIHLSMWWRNTKATSTPVPISIIFPSQRKRSRCKAKSSYVNCKQHCISKALRTVYNCLKTFLKFPTVL